MRARVITYALLFVVLWVYTISVSVVAAERGAPHATILNLGDALYWSIVTMATVGYGDMVPVTVLGRLLAVMLMLSGIIISRRVWEGIPDALKPELIGIAERHLNTLREQTTTLEQEAVRIMLANGLQIHPVSPQERAEWERVMGKGLELITGTVVSEQMIAEIQTHLDELRMR